MFAGRQCVDSSFFLGSYTTERRPRETTKENSPATRTALPKVARTFLINPSSRSSSLENPGFLEVDEALEQDGLLSESSALKKVVERKQ